MNTTDVADLFGHTEEATDRELLFPAEQVVKARQERDRLEQQLAAAKERCRHLEEQLLLLLDQQGSRWVRTGDVRLTACKEAHYRLDKETLAHSDVLVWLKRMGGHDLLETVVADRPLTAFCRLLEKAGKPLHRRLRRIERRYVRLTKEV